MANDKKKARGAKVRTTVKQEADLAETMLYALTTMEKDHAAAWMKRVKRLSVGMSAASIKRARNRAHKMADELPPGHIRAMEAMDLYEDVCRDCRIGKRDQDTLWGAVAQLCMFQLASRRGPFYEAARDFRLVQDPRGHAMAGPIVIDREFSGRDTNTACGCPSCRPRKPEELN
jgi:hypothetical protein